MSRTYRLRHLPQSEGGRSTRRFVDGRLRHPAVNAEEDFLSHLAHVELKLPCLLKGGPNARCTGWRRSHESCLPRDVRDRLNHIRPGGFWRLGWIRTVTFIAHPLIGYSLAAVPSPPKKLGRKFAYRRNRRHTKRLLRLQRAIRYLDEGTCTDCDCNDPFCDLGGIPELRWTHGTEFDPDEDRMNFEKKSIKAGLSRSAWLLTW